MMRVTSGFLLICACVAYANAIFCSDFEGLDSSNSREVYLSVKSSGCGVPVEKAAIRQDCITVFGSKSIAFRDMGRGFYRYRAPFGGHYIECKRAGYRTRYMGIPRDRLVHHVDMECTEPGCSATKRVEVTVYPTCGQTDVSDVTVFSSDANSVTQTAPGVYTVTSCPNCTPDMTLVMDGTPYTLPAKEAKNYRQCEDGSVELWMEVVEV